MLRRLFGFARAGATAPETQRQAFKRLMTDLNEAMEQLPEKPRFVFDPNSGQLELLLPDILPDETLALPAPSDVKAAA